MKKTKAESSVAKQPADPRDLVIITGLSGSGKATVLRVLEDLGYYSVDHLPIELIPKFAELVKTSSTIRRAALVIDVREGQALVKFPALYKKLREELPTRLIFLEASENSLVRRFSETRRPHPLGAQTAVLDAISAERKLLAPIRKLAEHVVDTSKTNVHELREIIEANIQGSAEESKIALRVVSFGFRNGVPQDADLVFDVRFLPNPNYIPEFKPLTGKHPRVARYIRGFPQTREFIERLSDMLIYLLPHYIREGKSYLTIAIGCTGGQHRSVMMASEIRKLLSKAGYSIKESHRDMPR